MSKLNSTSPGQVMQNVYDETNQALRTTATAVVGGDITVDISAADGDSVIISDGTNNLAINSDGSINVTSATKSSSFFYNEITAVPSATLSTVISITAPINSKLDKITISGSNVAEYQILVNSTLIDKVRTCFGGALNVSVDFGEGYPIAISDSIQVKVLHQRPSVGDFNARVSLVEV